MTNKENPLSPPLLAGVAAFRRNLALKELYARLTQRGKPHTLGPVACARIRLVFANAVLAPRRRCAEKPAGA